MTRCDKSELKQRVADCLSGAPEIRKIVVFGSFLTADSPNDMDVAVFLDRNGEYLPLALKYRRMTRPVAELIPLDIIPVRPDATGATLEEISEGEVIYER
ncbi:MAG TPA: nucleotidyltransferase domain-containing protein [Candidatus Hydrogenedentes bacterium]|nr:nucleotidyltransferase domain-containing protein [Candidatus Hydrogenedentota bacterium]HNT88164.1 nucleotidyltransferase domain-containing protein [Candidatus Hydrogenedentota bacterium]